jgi:hypothetical protein
LGIRAASQYLSVMPIQPPSERRRSGRFLALLAEHADGPFVQDEPVAQPLGQALAAHGAEGGQRHRLGAQVGDGVGDGEHIVLVDLDAPGEAQARSVVIGKGDGAAHGQGVALGQSPLGAVVGQAGDVLTQPAELGKV